MATPTRAWVFLALLCACGPQAQTPSAEGMYGAKSLSVADRARLARLADSGDWRAARNLALNRFWLEEKYDAETVRWFQLWSRADSEGIPQLVWLLSRSCAQEDRERAVRLAEEKNLREDMAEDARSRAARPTETECLKLD